MTVKWHFSWVHTGSFLLLPTPVLCESVWTWLYWSRRRDTVGAVSQWSSGTVQFFRQGFVHPPPSYFSFLHGKRLLARTGSKALFSLWLKSRHSLLEYRAALKKKRRGGDVICHNRITMKCLEKLRRDDLNLSIQHSFYLWWSAQLLSRQKLIFLCFCAAGSHWVGVGHDPHHFLYLCPPVPRGFLQQFNSFLHVVTHFYELPTYTHCLVVITVSHCWANCRR